jgi:hypothetical protein
MTAPYSFRVEIPILEELRIDVCFPFQEFSEKVESTILVVKPGSNTCQTTTIFLNENENLLETLEMTIITNLQSVIDENNKFLPKSSKSQNADYSDWIQEYKKCARYSTCADLFQEAYLHIVRNNPTLFDTLLQLETSYMSAFTDAKSSLREYADPDSQQSNELDEIMHLEQLRVRFFIMFFRLHKELSSVISRFKA